MLNEMSMKKNIVVNLSLILFSIITIPFLLDLIELNFRIVFISFIGNVIIIFLIAIMILDVIFLIIKKQNVYFLTVLSMYLSLILFLIMIYSFLNNTYKIVYVMNYSNNSLPLVYKIVAIWAGEEGSIMTWMLFNSITINLYRIGNRNKEDLVFIRSVILSSIISTAFLIILLYLNPFELQSSSPSDGLGLNPILISPFMIWHPFFTFIAYAVYLVPFTITISEIITRKSKLKESFQIKFYNFTLKFGWLVLTLSIGLGAYWAKIALTWGRYWGWDPVETVSLIPWFFITAFFHTIIFKKKNPLLIKINVALIFSSIVFSTLITRGGGLTSLHAFTGGAELVIWVVILGSVLIFLPLYVIYIVLDYLMEEYRNKKLLFDYLSYLFLYGLAFVCIFGLYIPPITFLLSILIPINTIHIGPDFFIITTLILATGLGLSLIFCSLWEYFEVKKIGLYITIAIFIQSVLSFILLVVINIWINPVLIIFMISFLSSMFRLGKNFKISRGAVFFFRLNSKTIIHAGISLILAGFLMPSNFQDMFFIPGFVLLLIGIVPSIISSFFLKKNEKKIINN
ncbi:MAG: cytochrome c biogenesis protein CcsA [Candidatus Hermodarchaeota archaeon]